MARSSVSKKIAGRGEASPSKKMFKPGRGKSWSEKVNEEKEQQIKYIDKAFADIPAGAKMLIATPQIVANYLNHIPKGKHITIKTLRNDLAQAYNAEYTCPVTTGIFLRIVSEAAFEQIEAGKPIAKVAPFWRVVDEKSPLAKKLSFGSDFLIEQRAKEGIGIPSNQNKRK